MGSYTIVLGPIALVVLVQIVTLRWRRALKHLPPGPKPLPFIGNWFDMPSEKPWLKYGEWKKQYGDIIYLNALGTQVLVLNSLKACTDLLDKRSAIYSDRTQPVMTIELVSWDHNFGLMGHTQRWRRHRRLFHQYFNGNATIDHRPVQESYAHKLLQSLASTPEDFVKHLRFSFAQVIMDVCYGIRVKGPNDPYITIAEIVAGPILTSASPGRYLVNNLPFLKYIPSWMPGAQFKQQALEWRQVAQDMKNLPFAEFQRNMASGAAGSCVLASMLSRNEEKLGEGSGSEEESLEEAAKCAVGTAYSAGADTTISAIHTLFMVMANNPQIQERAHAELDRVVGKDKLPTFGDAKNLLYINAIIKELLRWHTIIPLAVPHRSTEDDEYEGYFIPKGTIILPNSWFILHDPETYPEPHIFNPSRWLIETEETLKPNSAMPEPTCAFGYGRRACAGRHFAENTLFILVSSILACFNIAPIDDAGRPTERIEEKFTDGMLSHPAPFKTSIKPRSDKIVSLINDAVSGTD